MRGVSHRSERTDSVLVWTLCQKTIELKKRGVEAWDKRQDHVKVHLKKGETILNWYLLDSDIPKDKLLSKKYIRSPSPRPPSTRRSTYSRPVYTQISLPFLQDILTTGYSNRKL
jgi:hypothetical protein